MNKKRFAEAISMVDDKYYEEAANYQRKKKTPVWLKWGAMVACLCLIVTGVLLVPKDRQSTVVQEYTLSQAEEMLVELVEWGGDHFKATVVDTGNNSIFPANAELSVVFDYDTAIILSDGTHLYFNPDEPNTEVIGWEIGTNIRVEFLKYHEYLEGNHFYNQLIASCVEVSDMN